MGYERSNAKLQQDGEIGRGRGLKYVWIWVNNYMTALSRTAGLGDL